MPTTTALRDEVQSHLRALGTLLVHEGQLVLTEGVSVAQLADAFEAEALGDATTLMEWLAGRPRSTRSSSRTQASPRRP